MITKININGFKSFYKFEMNFTPFTVIAGPNGSGKSNLFDALQLLSRLAECDLKTAFSKQRGNSSELFTKFGGEQFAHEMEFEVELLINRTISDNWGGVAQLNNTRLKYILTIGLEKNDYGLDDLVVKHESLEKIPPNDDLFLKLLPSHSNKYWKTMKSGGTKAPFIQTEIRNNVTTIKIRQDGKQGGKATPASSVSQTVLSSINSVDFPHVFAVKEEMRKWKFLQLSPEYLREPTRQDINLSDNLTSGGKNLAAALFRIKKADEYNLMDISKKLSLFLPDFTEVNVYDDKVNQQYIIKLKEENQREFSSRVLSEGTLRLLALCILESDDQHNSLLCFEEPENGVHPFRLNAMAQLLKDLSTDFSEDDDSLRQVIINTHSPALIKVLTKWKINDFVSIWFSKYTTLISNVYNARTKVKISRMEIVSKSAEQLSFMNIPESERKLHVADLIDYLERVDYEGVDQR